MCWSDQGHHSLAGDGFGEALRAAVGKDLVGVVKQPVDGRGASVLGMIVSKPDGLMLLVTATDLRS